MASIPYATNENLIPISTTVKEENVMPKIFFHHVFVRIMIKKLIHGT